MQVDTNTKKSKESESEKKIGHDHSAQLRRLSKIKGQVQGIERMILDRKYCPEIIIQIKSIRSALKGLEFSIAEGHIRHCVKAAIKSRDMGVAEEKLEEILSLMKGQN